MTHCALILFNLLKLSLTVTALIDPRCPTFKSQFLLAQKSLLNSCHVRVTPTLSRPSSEDKMQKQNVLDSSQYAQPSLPNQGGEIYNIGEI